MMIDRRTNDAPPGGRRIDPAGFPRPKLERELTRVSVIRRSSDAAADMGDWIIDETDG